MVINHVVPPPANINQYEQANTLLPGQPTGSVQQLSPTAAAAAENNNEQALHRRTNTLDTNGHLRVNEDSQPRTAASQSAAPMGNQLSRCACNVVMGTYAV
jgi:hypothetical protein